MLNFIINRYSGNESAKNTFKKVRDYLNKTKIVYRVFYSLNKLHIIDIVKSLENQKEEVIIVVGGDGTINNVVNAIEKPQITKLGIIPSGKDNNFALSLGISLDPIVALKTILNNQVIKVDLINVSGTKAVNSVVVAGNYFLKARKNKSIDKAYNYNIINIIKKAPLVSLNRVVDGKELGEDDVNTLLVANGKTVLNGYVLNPNAKLDDGKLELIEFKSQGLKLSFKNKNYKEIDADRIIEKTLSKIIITSGEELFDFLVDGELYTNLPCEISVIKNGLLTYSALKKE